MSYSSSFAHLDGVEFKLSDTFKVPKVDNLPSNFKLKDLTQILLESEYDFSKEHCALAKIHAARENERKKMEEEEERKTLSLKRKEEEKLIREKQQREIFEKQRELFLEQRKKQQEHERASPESFASSNGSSPSPQASPSSENAAEVPPIPPKNPIFNQVGSLTLLTPVSVKSQEPSEVQNQSNQTLSTASSQSQLITTGSNQIWADFEDKGLDPFSNMELQTIDDIKELGMVLQSGSMVSDLAKNDLDIPSYKEASSSQQIYENVAANSSLYENVTVDNVKQMMAEQSQDVNDVKNTTNKAENKTAIVSSTNPFYSNIIGNPKSEEKDVAVTDINRNYENVKPSEDSGFQTSDVTLSSTAFSGAITATSATASANTITTTNTNAATDEEITNKPIPKRREFIDAKKIVPPPPVTEIESIYSFANDPGVKEVVTQEVNKDTEQNSYSMIGQESTSAVYAQVKPKRIAPKPPGSQDITGSNRNKSATPKVLPVCFGASSPPSTILPPITTASVIANNIYSNMSQNNITRPPRRPPVPPRDPQLSWQMGQSWVKFSNTSPISSPPSLTPSLPSPSPVISHSSPSLTPKLPPNGPTTRSVSALDYSKPIVPPRIRNVVSPPASSSNNEHFKNQSQAERAKFDENVDRALSSLPNRSNEQVNRSSEQSSKVQGSPKPTRTFVKQSPEERAKFEAAMNRALTSLPQNPSMPRKPTTPTPDSYSALGTRNIVDHTVTTPARPVPVTPAVSLSPSERKFVSSITSMGFGFDATVRAMKIHGKDDKEVVDHLCIVQKICEEGFSICRVQDAFEIFKNDVDKIMQFLHQFTLLTDMGFAEDDVKKALCDANNDQTQALEMLMGRS